LLHAIAIALPAFCSGPALHFGPFPSLRIASRLTLFYFLPFYGIIVVAVSFGVPF